MNIKVVFFLKLTNAIQWSTKLEPLLKLKRSCPIVQLELLLLGFARFHRRSPFVFCAVDNREKKQRVKFLTSQAVDIWCKP